MKLAPTAVQRWLTAITHRQMAHYVGVDVGTGSVRSAVVDSEGRMLSTATQDIRIWNTKPDFYEQSSSNIWTAVVKSVKEAMTTAAVDKEYIEGIGFDATCSLVLLDADFKPVCISPSGEEEVDVVMWMDHRAGSQAEHINATGHRVLRSVGGVMSPEMQPPKLLWLKQNMPDAWKTAAHLFDLPDFLTWRATGSLSRSLCSLVCKWGFQADSKGQAGWSPDFMAKIGLDCLLENNASKIGSTAVAPGQPCGGLSLQAAAELGLKPGTSVATSVIDAYAGGIGCLACSPQDPSLLLPSLTSRLALICGTSTCHMTVSEESVFVPGVWGPYFSVMLPGLWSNEGGQSATGKLIDFVVETHCAYTEAVQEAKKMDCHLLSFLNQRLTALAQHRQVPVCELTQHFHVLPDFHGNRSPLADPSLKGMVSGLSLSAGVDDLAVQYLATIQALSYGTKHIIDEMNSHGHQLMVAYVCGGLRKNSLFNQVTADVTGLPVILPDSEDSVLLGSAILGAYASGNFSSLQDAMLKMGGSGQVIHADQSTQSYHSRKYKVFKLMLEHQQQCRQIMSA